MGLEPLSEYPLEQPCALCGRRNDLDDDCYCSACCYAMAMAAQEEQYPDWFDNMKGWLAHKMGIGTLPIAFIIWGEFSLSYFMGHPVMLPTPVGYELMDMSVRAYAVAKQKTDRVVKVAAPPIRSTITLIRTIKNNPNIRGNRDEEAKGNIGTLPD